jgi:hypothetical protein
VFARSNMSGQLPPGSQAANTSSQQPPTGSKQTNVSPISMSPPHRTLLPVVLWVFNHLIFYHWNQILNCSTVELRCLCSLWYPVKCYPKSLQLLLVGVYLHLLIQTPTNGTTTCQIIWPVSLLEVTGIGMGVVAVVAVHLKIMRL